VANMPDSSNFRIPEQKKEKSWFDIRPRQISAWAQSLPLGDSEETTKQFFSVLSHINRVDISASARLKAMEALHPTYRLCITSQKQNYTEQSFPLGNRAIKYVDRAIALYSEQANAYKIASLSLLKRDRFYDKKSLAYSLYMAMDTLSDILLTHYQIYAPEPPVLWSEIHTIYCIAEQKGIHTLTIRHPLLKQSSTIEKKYKQTLLLSLSNPYHLAKNDVERVHHYLEELADSARILNPVEVESGEANFVVCMNQDKPPIQLGMIRTLENYVCRFLDTTDLVQQLRYRLSQTQEDPSLTNESSIYQRLLTAWDLRKKRSFSRSPGSSGIDVSMGLNGTHFMIDENSNPEKAEGEKSTIKTEDNSFIDDSKNPLEVNHTTFSIEPIAGEANGETYWDSGNNPRISNLTSLTDKYDATPIPKPAYQYHQWKTLNIGAGGYCLLWDHDKSSNAQIGEIVGIRETGQGKDVVWRIGVVRWMQYLRTQGLKLGIQILSPSATALQAKLMKGRASKKKEYSCLGLPEVNGVSQPASLLTPSLHYKVGDALILNDSGKMVNVQLTRLIEHSGNFSRFQFSPLNARENKEFEQELDRKTDEWIKLK